MNYKMRRIWSTFFCHTDNESYTQIRLKITTLTFKITIVNVNVVITVTARYIFAMKLDT